MPVNNTYTDIGSYAYGRCYKITIKDPYNKEAYNEDFGDTTVQDTSRLTSWGSFSKSAGRQSEGTMLVLEQTPEKLGLTIDFKVTKRMKRDEKKSPNSLILNIDNISEENFGQINTGDIISLECGYNNKLGQIFVGRIQSATRRVGKTGSKTKIVASETYIQEIANWQVQQFTAKKGRSIRSIAAAFCVSLVKVIPQITSYDVSAVPTLPLPRDTTFYGDPWKELHDLIKPYQMVYYTNNGKISCVRSFGDSVYTHVILDNTNGLLNYPSRKKDSLKATQPKKTNRKKDIRWGWVVESLINPDIQLGSRLSVFNFRQPNIKQADAAPGTPDLNKTPPVDSQYLIDKNLVEAIIYRGNSRAGSWKMSILTYDVAVPEFGESNPLWHEQYRPKKIGT